MSSQIYSYYILVTSDHVNNYLIYSFLKEGYSYFKAWIGAVMGSRSMHFLRVLILWKSKGKNVKQVVSLGPRSEVHILINYFATHNITLGIWTAIAIPSNKRPKEKDTFHLD